MVEKLADDVESSEEIVKYIGIAYAISGN